MTDGVMVAQKFLVLLVKVRVLIGQQSPELVQDFFYLHLKLNLIKKKNRSFYTTVFLFILFLQ